MAILRASACEFRLIAFDECGPLDQILRRIAAEAQLGKYSHIRAAGFRFAREFQNARRIAFKIANDGIELCEGNLHGKATSIRGDS